jgi:hypothetical protein
MVKATLVAHWGKLGGVTGTRNLKLNREITEKPEN